MTAQSAGLVLPLPAAFLHNLPRNDLYTADQMRDAFEQGRQAALAASPAPSAGMVAKWRKRPVVIEAAKLDRQTGSELAAWCGGQWLSLYGRGDRGEDISHVRIQTPEGVMRADLGDWIIKGVAGEFYPCKPDIFAATYEPAEAPSAGLEQRARELLAFLNGEGTLDGLWFGEKDAAGRTYWWRDHLPALAAAPAAGGVLVPREPTEEMVQVGYEALRTNNSRDSSEQGRVKRIYQSMLAAAPQAQGEG